MPEEPLHHLLWAKGDKSGQFHPLICHLVDVAQVAQSLWNYVLTDSLRDHFADLLGFGRDDSGRLLSFWIGLHDLGKASPAFQRRCVSAHARLTDAGLTFPNLLARQRCAHASLSALTLPFLHAVNPQVAIISVGADNRFGHPDELTLEKLEEIPTYRTDQQGNVQVVSDGERYWVLSE